MEKMLANIKNEWKAYIMAVWMIGVTGFLYHLYGQVQVIQQTNIKLSSDVDAIESVSISTDNNVAEMKKQVEGMSSKVANIHKRVMRR